MTTTRVAVAPGRHAVRVAGVTGGGAPRLLAELPAHLDGRAAALAGLLGPDLEEVVLVYPPGRVAAVVQAWLDAAAELAPRVVRVAYPVAAAAGTGAHAVLDVGRSGAEATLLSAGRIVARRSSGVGGDRLDLVVRALLVEASAEASASEARQVREALSLLPATRHGPVLVEAQRVREALTPLLDEAVATLAEVVAAVAAPVTVLLTGGVARCPLLAERVDAAGLAAEVRVAPRPDLAAVLGALTLPSPAPPASPSAPRRSPRSPPLEKGARLLRTPPPTRRALRWGRVAVAALLVGGLAGTGTAVAVPLRPASAGAADVPAGVLVQYGYRLDVPPGWEHTGGLPERRRSLLTRVGAPEGTDLIAVERTPLAYDADAEHDRAAAELRAEFDRSVATGSTLSGYGTARIGDRPVTTYLQRESAGAVVEWFVVLDGDAQLSVGCRHTPAGADAVRAACAVVVASIRRA